MSEVDPLCPAEVQRFAVFSDDGLYRYRLDRSWGSGPPMVMLWLNPSTADAESDDPTVRRGMGFARAAGCGRLVVVNLFGWRATNPAELQRVADPVGPDNDAWIAGAVAEPAAVVVAGWGARADPVRVSTVLDLVRGTPLFCWGPHRRRSAAAPAVSAGDHPVGRLRRGRPRLGPPAPGRGASHVAAVSGAVPRNLGFRCHVSARFPAFSGCRALRHLTKYDVVAI